jgi:hypothetical protein
MSTTRSESQAELLSDASAIPMNTPVHEYSDRPLLSKLASDSNPMISHVDENNENEAVRFIDRWHDQVHRLFA